ncbi:MAG: metal ABC transporter substrate-binding protein [Rickettsiales bacterium]
MKLFKINILLLVILISSTSHSKNILVSIRPIMSIVKNITCDDHIELLINKNISPHHYHLSPSDLSLLKKADVIIIVSRDLETSIYKAIIKNEEFKNKLVVLEDTPGLKLRKFDSPKEFFYSSHHHHHEVDPHIWLDVSNVQLIAQNLVKKTLKTKTSKSCQLENYTKYSEVLKRAQNKIQNELASDRSKSIIATHDAYNYLLNESDINTVGVLFSNHNSPPTIKELQNLKRFIQNKEVNCVIVEPQFRSKSIDDFLKSLKVKKAVVDIEWGPKVKIEDVYHKMMISTTKSISACLKN